jgi:hypothetical protein
MKKKMDLRKQVSIDMDLYEALHKIKLGAVVKTSMPAVLGHAIRNGIDATRKFFQPKSSTKQTSIDKSK